MKKKSEKIPQSNDEFLRHSMHRSQFASLIKKKEIRREKKKKKKIRIKAKQRRYRGSGGKKAIHAERIKRSAENSRYKSVTRNRTNRITM